MKFRVSNEIKHLQTDGMIALFILLMTIFLAEKEGLGGCCQDSTGLEGGNEAHQQNVFLET